MNTKKIINLGSTDFDFNLFVISIQCVKQKDSVLFCLEMAEFLGNHLQFLLYTLD